jgi:hypothetical protein
MHTSGGKRPLPVYGSRMAESVLTKCVHQGTTGKGTSGRAVATLRRRRGRCSGHKRRRRFVATVHTEKRERLEYENVTWFSHLGCWLNEGSWIPTVLAEIIPLARNHPSPYILAHIRGRYWSAKIDDISLWTPHATSLTIVSQLSARYYKIRDSTVVDYLRRFFCLCNAEQWGSVFIFKWIVAQDQKALEVVHFIRPGL